MLAAMLAACACGQHDRASVHNPAATSSDSVQVKVATVGFDEQAQAHFVLLIDSAGGRELPIIIGDNEAQAILLALRGVKPPRPLSDNLLDSVIIQTGNRIDRVEISNLQGEIYFAKIYLDNGKYAIDSRPSDAIALAMQAHAPIFVAAPLFINEPNRNLAGASPSISGPKTAIALGITVQDLTPELAAAFDWRSGHGVLVADADSAAMRAGIIRGDIVTQVNSHPVTRVTDFTSGIEAVRSGGPVTITVDRAGKARKITIQH